MDHLASDILVPFLDGELSADEARSCRNHLAACPACRIEAEQLGGVWDLLDAAPEPVVPEGLAEAVLARAAADAGRYGTFGRRLIRWGVPVAAAAAIVMAVLLQPESTSDSNRDLNNGPIVNADLDIPQGDIERILEVQDSLDVMNEYGDLIEHYDVLKRVDRILQDENVTL